MRPVTQSIARRQNPWVVFASIALLFLTAMFPSRGQSQEPIANPTVRVMTFNIWVGGEAGDQPLDQTIKVIRSAGADIVGLQETVARRPDGTRVRNTVRIANGLGWHFVNQADGRAILSRFEIGGLTHDGHGARVILPSGQELYVFNIHFRAAPYQPYQLLRIPYEDAPFLETADELVAAARSARGDQVASVLAEIHPLLKSGEPVVLTGDFNEPSHLDWTARAAAFEVVPIVVPYPTTFALFETGLRDAYRAVYPDETRYRGLTWTPTTSEEDPTDRHDRIDMIFVSPRVEPVAAYVVGEHRRYADIVVSPYPSDHRAVVAEITLTMGDE